MSESSGIVGVKIRVMPDSPSINLSEIEIQIKKIVEKDKGRNREYVKEPVAFGLSAIIAFFEWPEEKPLEKLEEELERIKGISSIQVIDMRKIA